MESIVFRDHLVRVTIWRLAYRITEGNYKTGGVARSSNATERERERERERWEAFGRKNEWNDVVGTRN